MELFAKKKRGRKGEGRATVFKAVNLPVDVLDDLRLYKSIYEMEGAVEKDEFGSPVPLKLSYEQVLRRWMEKVSLFDPKVAAAFEEAKAVRAKQPAVFEVDPTEGDVWEMQYFFTNAEGDEIPALLDEASGTFLAEVNGFKVTHANMELNDWQLINEAGDEISQEQARVIVRRIILHKASR